jgi:hypothetical protein
MQTVTIAEIRAAAVAAICAIVPTNEALRSVGWAYTPSGRKGGRAVLSPATRNFDVIMGAGTPSYAWHGGIGTAYQCRAAIATSYAGCEPDLLEPLITEDAVDLRRALSQLRDPALPGLAIVTATGIANEQVDSEANVYLEHTFVIHYHQSTD